MRVRQSSKAFYDQLRVMFKANYPGRSSNGLGTTAANERVVCDSRTVIAIAVLSSQSRLLERVRPEAPLFCHAAATHTASPGRHDWLLCFVRGKTRSFSFCFSPASPTVENIGRQNRQTPPVQWRIRAGGLRTASSRHLSRPSVRPSKRPGVSDGHDGRVIRTYRV